jgi:hypothetical protein
MKAKSKSELAANAGISLNTLRSWCNDCREELIAIGWRPTMRVLPPNIVQFLADRYCIDIE